MIITKRSRYRGALVGLLAGDALGAPYETWATDAIAHDLAVRKGLVPFDYLEPWRGKLAFPAGRPTDDSEQAAALATTLVVCHALDEEYLYRLLREQVYEERSLLWNGRALGAGKTTRARLKPGSLEESRLLVIENEYPSNGALMRSAPLALFFGNASRVNRHIVARACKVTHQHPLAEQSVQLYVHILACLLQGAGMQTAIGSAQMLAESWSLHADCRLLFDKILPQNIEPIDPGRWPERGHTLFTLHVALWTAMNARDFADGITQAIRVGGDTDTYAAVAGALLGARYGEEGIPEEWRKILKGGVHMALLAEGLYDQSHTS